MNNLLSMKQKEQLALAVASMTYKSLTFEGNKAQAVNDELKALIGDSTSKTSQPNYNKSSLLTGSSKVYGDHKVSITKGYLFGEHTIVEITTL